MENKYPLTSGSLVIKYGAFNSNEYYIKDNISKMSGFANKDMKEILLRCDGIATVSNIIESLSELYDCPKTILKERIEKSLKYFDELGIIHFSDKPLPTPIIFLENNMEWSLDVVYLEITNLCNLSCIHCYANTNQKLKKELNTEEILRLIDRLSELGVLEIIVTGGEPFVRKDIFTILDYIKSKHMDFSLFTNGVLLDKNRAEKLKVLKPKIVAISVDSHIEHIHNHIRGSKSFLKTISNIEILVKEGLPVRTNTTLFNGINDGQQDIDNLVEYLTEKGIGQIVVGDLITYGRGTKLSALRPDLLIAKRVMSAFKNIKTSQRRFIPSLKFNESFVGEREKDKHSICGIGTFSCAIRSNGNIGFCPVLDPKDKANILEKDIKDIWLCSDIFEAFREKTVDEIEKCGNCSKLNECLGGCKARSYMYNEKFNSPDFWMCSSYDII